MTHTITGYGFHGNVRLRLRGPNGPFVLSAAQERKVQKAFCGYRDCQCGGLARAQWACGRIAWGWQLDEADAPQIDLRRHAASLIALPAPK